MKKKAKYKLLSLWLVTIVLSAALWLAQTNGVTAQKEAISKLAQFTNEVSNMRSVVSKPLGPYTISTSCTFCIEKEWWGLGLCTKEKTQRWSAKVDFTGTRQPLLRTLERSQQNANAFSSRYQPIQAWISGLPEFSKKFDNAANLVLTIQQDIKAGIGPNDTQRVKVTQTLQGLVEDLDRSASLLQGGTSALAAFLQQQSANRDAIRKAIDSADQSSQQALINLEKQTSTQRCQDGVKEKYDGIRSDFSRSLQEILAAFQTLQGSSQEAEKGLALLMGNVLSSQTDLKSVLDSVNAARNDQMGSFLEQLHLNAAKKQWKAMADYAVGNLSN